MLRSGISFLRFGLTIKEIYFAGVLSLIIVIVSGLFVGMVLGLDARVFAASLLVFAIVVLSSRMVSLGSILTAASIPLLFRFVAHETPYWRLVISIGIALAVILKHHSNIARLARGTERKLGRKKEDE